MDILHSERRGPLIGRGLKFLARLLKKTFVAIDDAVVHLFCPFSEIIDILSALGWEKRTSGAVESYIWQCLRRNGTLSRVSVSLDLRRGYRTYKGLDKVKSIAGLQRAGEAFTTHGEYADFGIVAGNFYGGKLMLGCTLPESECVSKGKCMLRVDLTERRMGRQHG